MFKVIGCSGELPVEFISTNESVRETQYEQFKDRGIVLYPYCDIKRPMLLKRDLKVFLEDWWIEYQYEDVVYKLTYLAGGIFDEASIPIIFRCCNGTAHNQYVSIPSAVHDALFALHLMPFEDANNIFRELLEWKHIPRIVKGRLMMGVRSFLGRRLYRKNNPEEHWLNGFVKFEVVHY